jgi:hypothetical protein
MKNIEMDYVKSTINNEGFDYCFRCYSNFEDIKDEKFHELRKAYLNAAKELEKYVNDHSKDDDN